MWVKMKMIPFQNSKERVRVRVFNVNVSEICKYVLEYLTKVEK